MEKLKSLKVENLETGNSDSLNSKNANLNCKLDDKLDGKFETHFSFNFKNKSQNGQIQVLKTLEMENKKYYFVVKFDSKIWEFMEISEEISDLFATLDFEKS